MTVVLPKDRRHLIGYRFPELIPFEFNTVDLSLVLVALFRRAILEGRGISGGTADDLARNANIAEGVEVFATNEGRLEGFDTPQGRRAANRLVQGTLTRLSRAHRSKELQIRGLEPYTIASVRAAFPMTTSGDTRRVDNFLYHLLLSQWPSPDSSRRVHDFIVEIFGEGVVVERHPNFDARRASGDLPDLDILSELSLAFAEQLHPILSKEERNSSYVAANPLPSFQDQFGSDLRKYWKSYAAHSPTLLLIEQTITLVRFELMVMTLKLFHALPALVDDHVTLPPAMTDTLEPTHPEIYVDWTGDQRHLSWELARASARRDLAQVQPFVRATLQLRYLNNLVAEIQRDREFRSLITSVIGKSFENDTPSRMQSLLILAEHADLRSEIRTAARHDRSAIQRANQADSDENRDESESRTTSEADRLIMELEDSGTSAFDQVLHLIWHASGRQAQKNLQNWLADVGGVGTSHGLIHGSVNRRTWAYAPGNELLTVLVQLCAVDHGKKGADPSPFGLADFLEWLEDRFGIIVDRPPAGLGFDGPEPAAAARENLQAMLRRLRLMGMFEDQSDDFTVQEITPPFATYA